ncbi:GrpB family protein [Kineosporia sp. J2-2]|uniref:GrpB family protein n=1 Tax=Kineosporia corallincola TaxID=2835133 RepID=A0ABS5TDV0_9ACTN|nr:GrpB family protein [Kineosporia corallincola]MBT0769013.1 GrpB family protein [Kineosporia corallincola]
MTFGLIGGPEKRDIILVGYSDSWPSRFRQERDRIVAALGEKAVRVDHVGSTSIPGLTAKPIIDIDLSVSDADDEADYLPQLLAAGYELRVREPDHRLVRTPDGSVHVHICSTGSEWERRHLLFRDWLRRDVSDRDAYAALKVQLAQHDWPDTNAYSDAKGGLIAVITDRAESWAAATGWTVWRS